MLTQYTLKMPHVVYSGQGALNHVKEVVKQNAAKAAVFSDKGIIGAGLLDKTLCLIEDRKSVV